MNGSLDDVYVHPGLKVQITLYVLVGGVSSVSAAVSETGPPGGRCMGPDTLMNSCTGLNSARRSALTPC